MRFVDFEGLWKMAIDTPYSLLVSSGSSAWTCGQLAMDENAEVVAPGDLDRQAEIVADYIAEILRRADLTIEKARRLVLYYVGTEQAGASMRSVLKARFGDTVLFDPVPVPSFYYEGVMLEIDVFCGGAAPRLERVETPAGAIQILTGDEDIWVSLETAADATMDTIAALRELLAARGLSERNILTEHWVAPTLALEAASRVVTGVDASFDRGAILDAGANEGPLRARFRLSASEVFSSTVQNIEGARIVTRTGERNAWVQARALDPSLDLVAQTRLEMRAIAIELDRLGLSFADVVKQTSHYVGGTADELHDNMSIRNGYYKKPGPASTGIPVYGIAAPGIRNVIDLTIRRGWRG